MARPFKTGLDYFSLDVDLDEKFELIESIHELSGFAIVVKLYQRIYRSGYFISWTDDNLHLFRKKVGVEVGVLNSIIDDCLRIGIFDQLLYLKYKILTSSGIQKRYLSACERRKSVDMIREYVIVSIYEFKVSINLVNVDINSDNADVNPIFQQGTDKRYFMEIDEVEDYLRKDEQWCQVIAMQNHLTIDQVHHYIAQFVEVLKSRGEKEKHQKEAKSHFANWYKAEHKKTNHGTKREEANNNRKQALLAKLEQLS